MVATSNPLFSALGTHPGGRKVAVVLNVNARKVDQKTVGLMQSIVSERDLFVSQRPEDGARIADEVVAKGYDAVLWGGGDGTFAAGVAALVASAGRRGVKVPDVGVLPFGTGNAVAWSVGASSLSRESIAGNLNRARNSSARRRLQMLNVEGQPTIFCGFGLDAQVLDDFGKTVGVLRKAGLAQTVRSAGFRYFLSVASRSIPRFIAAQRAEVVAINRGAPAIKVDGAGNPIGSPVPAGRVLWRGLASLASCSTIPYYGLGMKMFPQAEKLPGRFQLRVSDMSAVEALSHLHVIWRGDYESPRLSDFLVDEVELVLDRAAPFQSGGDLVGNRDRVTISLWDRPIGMV